MGYKIGMHTVAETPTITRQASKLFTDDEKRELIDLLATDPLADDVIPGTGGVRKLRFAAAGTGKRGAAASSTTTSTTYARLRAAGLRRVG